MQREYYNSTADIMAIENHRGHDANPDYYGLLLKEVIENPEIWKDKSALDFGCGIGRNVDNILRLASWKNVDGCDISSENVIRATNYLKEEKHLNFNLYTTDGISLTPIQDNSYDFVLSTIVLQHIAVHTIRKKLLTDIYRVMKPGALFSFQMAQYTKGYNRTAVKYFDNALNIKGTNGAADVNISDPQDLIDDLVNIGYKHISHQIRPEWDAGKKCYMDMKNSRWIFIKSYK